MHIIRSFRVFLVLSLLLVNFLLAGVDYLPVNEVRAGMKGYLITVFEGVNQVQVEFEVKGITYELINSESFPIIWAQAYIQPGQVVPAAGQSGSPCWIYTEQGEKFLGLLAFSYSLMDKTPVFGIAAYEEILKRIISNPNLHPNPQSQLSSQSGNFQPPLLIGFSSRDENLNLNLLNYIFPNAKFISISTSSPDIVSNITSFNFKSGIPIPINIYFVKGDINLFVHGTLGVAEGKQFIALGHGIFGLGEVDLPVYPASVITTVENYFMSYRIPGPNIGGLLGVITTDSYFGVKGELGREPKLIPVNFAFQSENFSQQRNFEIVRVNKITPQLLSAIINYYLLNIGAEVGVNSLNRGSISIEATYLFKSKPPYTQTQVYDFEKNYSQIVYQYTKFFQDRILLPIFSNPEMLTDLDCIGFNVKVSPNFQKLNLEKIKVKGKIGPRKTINLELSLLSFDQTRYKTQLQFICPPGVKKGEGQIEVRTGMYFLDPPSSFKALDEYLRVQTNTAIFIKLVCYVANNEKNVSKDQKNVIEVKNEKGEVNSKWEVEKRHTPKKIQVMFELKLPVCAQTEINIIFLPDPQTGGFNYEK